MADDVGAAVAWLEAEGLIRRIGEERDGVPVFAPVALTGSARERFLARLAERLRGRGEHLTTAETALPPYAAPRCPLDPPPRGARPPSRC
jgi:hypothetical protein